MAFSESLGSAVHLAVCGSLGFHRCCNNSPITNFSGHRSDEMLTTELSRCCRPTVMELTVPWTEQQNQGLCRCRKEACNIAQHQCLKQKQMTPQLREQAGYTGCISGNAMKIHTPMLNQSGVSYWMENTSHFTRWLSTEASGIRSDQQESLKQARAARHALNEVREAVGRDTTHQQATTLEEVSPSHHDHRQSNEKELSS